MARYRSRFILVILLVAAANVFSTGVVDTEFGDNGTVFLLRDTRAVALSLAANGDSGIVVAANSESDAVREALLFRIYSSGEKDFAFGDSGLVRIPNVRLGAVKVASDGSLFGAGAISNPDGTEDLLIFKLDRQGVPDPGFGDSGRVIIDLAKTESFTSLAFADGKILAAGGIGDGTVTAITVLIFPDGSLDSAYGDKGIALYGFPYPKSFEIGVPSDVEVLPDGTAYVGGDWEFELDGRRQMGSYVIPFAPSGEAGGIQATPYAPKGDYDCNGSFDGEVLPDGRYVSVSRQGGINRMHDGSRIMSAGTGRLLVAGGCFGGGVKVYDAKDLHVIGAAKGIDVADAAPLADGRIAVLSPSGVVRLLKNITSNGNRQADFDGDDRADLAVYRPSEGKIYINNGLGKAYFRTIPAGNAKIIPEPASFETSIEGIVRDQTAFWKLSKKGAPEEFSLTDSSGSEYFTQSAGTTGDIPFAGDFDGDGMVDTGYFRPSEGTWNRKAQLAFTGFTDQVRWGKNGDKPVPADYDGDGITDHAVFRPSNGTWWILGSKGKTQTCLRFGLAGDIPLTGDFDGDGKSDLTVFRPAEGIWYQLLSLEGFRAARFGVAGDEPVPGDYDGDGLTDIALYRQGTWFLLMSSKGFGAFPWGQPGDVPVTARYDR